MSAATCPNCKAVLPARELAEGWCETCGKRIPSYLLSELPERPRYDDYPARSDRPSYRLSTELASRGARLGAVLLDALITSVLYVPVVVIVGITGEKDLDDLPMAGIVTLLASLVLLLALAILQIVLLSVSGQSLGKKIVGVRIVRHEDGRNPGFVGAVLLRAWLPGLIGAVPCIGAIFSLANIFYIFAEDRRCLHDHIAGTKVVVA